MIRILLSLILLFSPYLAYGVWPETDRQDVPAVSIIKNGGFENGRGQWVSSGGTFLAVTSGSNLLIGKGSATWDSSAAAQELYTVAAAIPNSLKGQNGVAQCRIMTPSGTATHLLQLVVGSDIIASTTVTSSTSPTLTQTNFIFPSSGNVQLKIVSVASDEPLIAIDDCFVGAAFNVALVSQATYVGGMEQTGAAGCAYAENTSSGLTTFVSLGTGSGCNAWTVTSNGPGVISAQGTNDHRLVYTNMPPGAYQVRISGSINTNVNGTCIWRLSDGTTTYQNQVGIATSTGGDSTSGLLEFHVPYTTAGTRTFTLQASDNHAGTCQVINTSSERVMSWKLYRFPTVPEQAVTQANSAQSWSGYHDNTCSWARTNAAYGDPTADASCALVERTNRNFGSVTSALSVGNPLPGVVFTPTRSGRYLICASPVWTTNAIAQGNLRLVDGSSNVLDVSGYTQAASGYIATSKLCGIVNAPNNSATTIRVETASNTGTITVAASLISVSAVEWSIVAIDQQLASPVLIGSVTSRSSGAVRTEGADVACATSSSITQQSGALSAIGNRASSACTLTILAGTFSTTPWVCLVTVKGSTAGSTACTCASATSCTITGPSAADFNAYVHLQGPR